MAAIEASLVSLSRSVTTALVKAWISRRSSDEPLSQLLQGAVPDPFERRRLERALEDVSDTIAARLLRDTEMSRLPDNERQAAAFAVSESLRTAALTRDDFLAVAMNPNALAKTVRARSRQIRADAGLSQEALRFYDAMIEETCSVLITAISAVPGWDSQTTTYLLRQQADLSVSVAAALERLPAMSTEDIPDPSALYAQSVISALDRVEFTGFPISVANELRLSDTFVRPDVSVERNRQPLEWALADHRRLFLYGAAGSGKTSTLLWLAIQSARRSLDGLVRFLNDVLPIYVPLNEPAQTSQHPSADATYLASIAVPALESDELTDLVRQRCESGSALLLIDGLDEVDPSRRKIWLSWIGKTIDRYPNCRVVVTSRVASLDVEPLADRNFGTAQIEPLDNRSKVALIRQWFAAAGPLNEDNPLLLPNAAAAKLTSLIERNGRLADLATTPLMCTLMCALFRERGELPLHGADVYSEFVDMLVERRDTVRGIAGARVLPKPEALALLEQLARHMAINGTIEIPRQSAYEIMNQVLPSFARLDIESAPALDHLIRRSGLLVEPAHGRTRFVHRTLQEYLAARSFVENDEIELLVKHAHDPAWRSTVVLAAAQARPWQGDQLIRGLLERSESASQRGVVLAAVIQECVSGMVRLKPELRQACETLWRRTTEKNARRIVLRFAAGNSGEELYEWLAEHDELQRLGPIVISRIQSDSHIETLLLAGDRLPESATVVAAVLEWYQLTPYVDRPAVSIEIEEIRIELGAVH